MKSTLVTFIIKRKFSLLLGTLLIGCGSNQDTQSLDARVHELKQSGYTWTMNALHNHTSDQPKFGLWILVDSTAASEQFLVLDQITRGTKSQVVDLLKIKVASNTQLILCDCYDSVARQSRFMAITVDSADLWDTNIEYFKPISVWSVSPADKRIIKLDSFNLLCENMGFGL